MQNMYNYLKKNLTGIAMFFVIIALFFLFAYMFSFSFILHDDLWYATWRFGRDIFHMPANNNYIASFFNRLFATYLPVVLNIHPSAFKGMYFSYIQSFIFLTIIYCFNGIIFAGKKKDYLYIVTFIFSSVVFFLCFSVNVYLFFNYDGIFRITLPFLFFFIFIYHLHKSIEDNSVKNSVIVCIFAFLCCICSEPLSITIPVACVFYILYSLVKKYGIHRNYALTFVLSLLSILLLFFSGTYMRKSGEFAYFVNIANDFGDFLTDYVIYVFGKHFAEFGLYIAQSVFLYIKLRKEENVSKIMFSAYSFLLGSLAFFASLIVLGKTFYTEGEFWLAHLDLHAFLSIMLWTMNFVLLNLILRYSLIKEYIIAIVLAVASFFVAEYDFQKYSNYLTDCIIPKRETSYKLEKIIRLADMQGRPALIDKEIMTPELFHDSFLINKYKSNEVPENVVLYATPFVNFFSRFGISGVHGVIIVDKERAEADFKEHGGHFSARELKPPVFSKLTDKDYVLGKKRNRNR